MARVTVEDCLEKVTNRFELVMMASKRARDIARGTVDPKVDWENDKPTVVALREIAEDLIDINYLNYDPEAEQEEVVNLNPLEMQDQNPEQPL